MSRRRVLHALLVTSLVLASVVFPPVSATGVPVTPERPFSHAGEFPPTQRHLVKPSDVSVAPDGDVLVADAFYKRVIRYSSAGSFITSYTVTATDAAGIDIPKRVAAAPDGTFYVAVETRFVDPDFRILHLSAEGALLHSFSGRGPGAAQFEGWADLDMAVEPSGDLVVLDRGASRIKRFSATGAFLGSIGSPGSAAGELDSPRAVTVDDAGTIWVVDGANTRLQGFAADGTSPTVETTYAASGIAARGGYLYYDDPFGRVSCVTTSGASVTSIASAGGWPIPVSALALSPDGGTLYAAGGEGWSESPPLGQVAVLAAPALTPVATWRSWGTGGASLAAPGDVAVGADGSLYVTNPANFTVKRYSAGGTFLDAAGSSGAGNGQFSAMGAVSADATGYVYVADNDRVQVFDSALGYVRQFAVGTIWIGDIEVDFAGRVYVADMDDDVIRVYAGSTEIASWGIGGNGPGQLNSPGSLALTRDGHIWVSDVYRVAKFELDGTYTGVSVCEHDESSVWPIALDPDGRLVVRDQDDRLRRYRADGTGEVSMGRRGFGPLEFAAARGMDFTPSGDLYVADTYNDRIQRLSPLQDTLPPVTEALVPESWVPWEFDVELPATDGCSGVLATRYRLAGATTSAETTYTGPIPITAEGTTTVTYYSLDASGHVESEKTAYARRDYSWPQCTPSVSPGQEISGATTVTLTATDPMSGVDWIDWKLDGGPVTRVEGSVARIPVTGTGYHTIQYRTADNAGNTWPAFDDVMFRLNATSAEVAGTDRYTTAVEISKRAYPNGAETVILASGRGFADALGAAALASAYDAPLLLTDPAALPDSIGNEIQRLGAERAIVVGGPPAVADDVKAAAGLRLTGARETTRVAGLDRYATSKAVYDAFRARLAATGRTFPGTVIIASGANFPDALAASPLAAYKSWPILLTRPGELPAPTLQALRAPGVTDAIIVGGDPAVYPAVETALETELGDPNVDRLEGGNRYQTALAIIARAEAEGLHWDGVCISTGTNYADALAGGPYAAKAGTFVALTPPTALNENLRTRLVAKKSTISGVRFLGGTSAVSQGVRNAVMDALND